MKWINLNDRKPVEGLITLFMDNANFPRLMIYKNGGYMPADHHEPGVDLVKWLDEEAEEVNPKLERIVKEHEQFIHTFHCGDLAQKIQSVLNHYRHDAAQAISERKKQTTETLVYFRSVILCAEMVGMGGTHGEKAARLRGLIELLNQAIKKLQKEDHNSLLDNWGYGFGGRSDYPYRSLLDEMRQLKYENEELKKKLGTSPIRDDSRHPNDDLPY